MENTTPVTWKSMKSLQRKNAKKYLQEVESILHPNAKINGIDILHRHLTSGKIEFTAWKGDNQINNLMVILSKEDILYNRKGLKDHLKWLCSASC